MEEQKEIEEVKKNPYPYFHSGELNQRKVGMISDVYHLLTTFTPYHEIKNYLFSRKKYLTEEMFEKIFRVGLERFKEGLVFTKEFLVQQSIYRYECEIRRLLNERDPKEIQTSLLLCLDTMRDLEQVVNLRSERIRVEVTNLIKKRESKLDDLSKLNLKKLTFEEKKEFLKLLQKSQYSDLEMESIKLSDGTKESEKNVKLRNKDKDYVQFEEIKTFEEKIVEEKKELLIEDIVKKVQLTHIQEERENENSNE